MVLWLYRIYIQEPRKTYFWVPMGVTLRHPETLINQDPNLGLRPLKTESVDKFSERRVGRIIGLYLLI